MARLFGRTGIIEEEDLFLDYLIGWYKFNEGGGTTVANFATEGSLGGGLLPNLTVTNTDGNFWTAYSGFGSTYDCGAADTYALANMGSTRTYGGTADGGFTAGIFHRRFTGANAGGTLCVLSDNLILNFANSLEFEDSGNYSNDIDWSPIIRYGDPANVSRFYATPFPTANLVWMFLFIDSTGKLNCVKADGTKIIADETLNVASSISIQYIQAGCWGTGNGIRGSYADWIIYNNKVLTTAGWAAWYDQLRSRYGMAARNGW